MRKGKKDKKGKKKRKLNSKKLKKNPNSFKEKSRKILKTSRWEEMIEKEMANIGKLKRVTLKRSSWKFGL